jgi:hypothetical protein
MLLGADDKDTEFLMNVDLEAEAVGDSRLHESTSSHLLIRNTWVQSQDGC